MRGPNTGKEGLKATAAIGKFIARRNETSSLQHRRNNEIIVGPKKYLAKRIINLDNLNILCDGSELNEKVYVKIRSTGKLIPSKVEVSGSKAKVNLTEDEFGVSPGQACVFYQKNKNGYKVLGGGWIKN